jgi:uncharacterized repeat protein (TIGR03803 family)
VRLRREVETRTGIRHDRRRPTLKTFAGAIAFAFAAAGTAVPAGAYTYKVLHDFTPDTFPTGYELFIDASGTLYGGAAGGVYSLTPNADRSKWTRKLVYPVDATGIIGDTAGNLYGTSLEGGAHNGGFVFELTPNADRSQWTLTTLVDFSFQSQPRSNVTYAGAQSGALYDGVSPLYGTTTQGGAGGFGVVFALTPDGGNWDYAVLHDFCPRKDSCRDGARPWGDVLADPAGNLFGTTLGGGYDFNGVLYELSPGSGGGAWTETILHRFCRKKSCADGASPTGSLVMDTAGALLGTTHTTGHCPKRYVYCGAAFALLPAGTKSPLTVLYSFCSLGHCDDGNGPDQLTLDAAGNLFGTTDLGGTKGHGTVFELSGTSEQVLHNFCQKKDCADGGTPVGRPAEDSLGNLYGTTQRGGKKGGGVLYELSP